MKKIGILGSGPVGKTLAKGFLDNGYQVMLASRDPEKIRDWGEQAGDLAEVGDFAFTAGFGDILVLAVGGSVALDALEASEAINLKGKTIMDATNPIASEGPENGVLRYFTEMNSSLMEKLQDAFPEANFVKAFNSIGSAVMVNPDFDGERPTMFICGNSEEAKREASDILELFGHEVEDMGTAEAARAIEPLAMLWCIPGFLHNKWYQAFRFLKK